MADTRSRVHRVGRRSGAQRKKQWAGAFSLANFVIASGVDTVISIVSPAQIDVFGGGKGTLVRTRGFIGIAPNAAATDPVVTWGLAVVDARAFAVGPTACPLSSDLEDLFAFGQWATTNLTSTTGFGPFYERIEVDSKAMRKYDVTDEVALVFTTEATGHSINLTFGLSCLLMEE